MVPLSPHLILAAISNIIALRAHYVENVTVIEQSNIRPDYNLWQEQVLLLQQGLVSHQIPPQPHRMLLQQIFLHHHMLLQQALLPQHLHLLIQQLHDIPHHHQM